jgi:hypothetical protein
MGRIRLGTKSVLSMYVMWMLILGLHSGWVVYTSSYRESAGSQISSVFLANYIGIAVLVFFVGSLFAWLTDKGIVWAKWLFMAYCTYRAVDSIWSVYWRETTISLQTDTIDWMKSVIFAVIWLFLVGLAWRARPNTSFSSDALKRAG